MVANFNLTTPSTSGSTSAATIPQKYILQSIQLRKPALVAAGKKQQLSHELEAVLVHREVTGTGYFANVIVPMEVRAEPGLDLLAPLLNEADLPSKVGETQPVLVSGTLPLQLSHVFAGASFQHFWGEITTSCNSSQVGARILLRNATMATSKPLLNRILRLLQYTPSTLPVTPPEETWLMQPCPRGSSCSLPVAVDLAPALTEAQAALQANESKLEAAKQAMDQSLLALTSNSTYVSNAAYNTAVLNRQALQEAEKAVEAAKAEVQLLQSQLAAASAGAWDAKAPPPTPATTTAAASIATTTTTAAGAASTTAQGSTTTGAATAATGASSTTGKVALFASASQSATAGCSDGTASPLEVDLSKSAEHVDARTAGASEALLFWRLSATSGGLLPTNAAAVEGAAKAPLVRVANLGDRLRVSPLEEGQPLLVLLLRGRELPISFADISVPGEHVVAGTGARPAAEIQLVHLPGQAEEAVAVALQLEEGEENAWLRLGALPRPGDVAEAHSADPMAMHPALRRGVAGRFFRYLGRLSRGFPLAGRGGVGSRRCAHVRWQVLEERGQAAPAQLSALRRLLRAPSAEAAEAYAEPSALSSAILLAGKRKVSLASVQSHTHTVRADSLAPGHAADADYPANPSSPLLRSLLRRKTLGTLGTLQRVPEAAPGGLSEFLKLGAFLKLLAWLQAAGLALRAAGRSGFQVVLPFAKSQMKLTGNRTLQCLQEESRVALNAVDSLDALLSDINKGQWDSVLQAVSYLSLPANVLQDLYSQVVLELAELKELETAQHLLKETAPMSSLKQANPERYLRIEALIKRKQFDAQEAYEGLTKEKIRTNLAQSVSKHVQVAPPSRLLALVGQAMKWQQHVGLLPKNARIDVFRGVAKDSEVEPEMCPTMVARTVKFGEKSHPECVAFSPDGQFCVSGSVDGFVEVWDYQTGTLRKDLTYQDEGSFMMHEKAVIAVAFNKDSELLATGSQDGQVKVWRIVTGQCARRYEKAHNQGVTCITWSKDSTQLLTGSFDFTARVHGIKSGKTLKEFRGHKSYVNSASFSKDNSRVITGSSDSHVIVFDAKTSEILNTLTPPPPAHCSSIMDYAVNSVIVAPKLPGYSEHEDLIFVCTRTNTILLMNLAGQVLKSFCSGKRDKGDFVAMTISPKGEWLHAVAEDNTLYCFSVASGGLEQTLKVADKEVIGIVHHPSRNVIAGFSGDGTMSFMRA
ncbi:unnamed protein product [Effrenium voratum]|nr:unnamed protein product [Effrenium voratum]